MDSSDGIPLFRSTLLAHLTHGFSTRSGGVSRGGYSSLNCGAGWGDDPAAVQENLRRLAARAGFALPALHLAHQVHGQRVLCVDELAPTAVAAEEADALVATRAGLVVGVITADCVPILMADDEGRVAAAHAGWRGTIADVAGATVRALCDAGARPAHLRAALGPSIGPCCFEVGDDVARQFSALSPHLVEHGRAKPRVDLRRANRLLLEAAGLPAAHIDDAPPCTSCDPLRFFSFRRDGRGIGEMLAFIAAPSLA